MCSSEEKRPFLQQQKKAAVGTPFLQQRDEHNERSDSQDVTEVDKAALSVSEEDNRFGSLASLPLALLDYC